jgi:hypothetical protein
MLFSSENKKTLAKAPLFRGFKTTTLSMEAGGDDGLQSRDINVGRLPEAFGWRRPVWRGLV